MPGSSRITILAEQLEQRRRALAEAILEVADADTRHVLAGRLAALVEAEAAIGAECARDAWLRASALYRVDRVTAVIDFERAREARRAAAS